MEAHIWSSFFRLYWSPPTPQRNRLQTTVLFCPTMALSSCAISAVSIYCVIRTSKEPALGSLLGVCSVSISFITSVVSSTSSDSSRFPRESEDVPPSSPIALARNTEIAYSYSSVQKNDYPMSICGANGREFHQRNRKQTQTATSVN